MTGNMVTNTFRARMFDPGNDYSGVRNAIGKLWGMFARDERHDGEFLH